MPISRWKKRPDGSNRGDFGPDDQPDYINYLLPQKVKEGIAEVKKGSSFSQNPPFGYPEGEKLDPDCQPPVLRPLLRQNRVNYHCEMDKLVPVKSDIPSDNMVIFFLQYTSHGEGLAHTGSLFNTQDEGIRRPFYYSGFAAGKNIIGPEQIKDSGIPTGFDNASTSPAYASGIEKMSRKAVQGRAVMLDLRAHFGDARKLVSYSDIMEILDKDVIEVTKGDILCLHTGFADLVLKMKRNPDKDKLENSSSVLDGSDEKLLEWLSETKIAALAADNYAVEAFPAREGEHSCALLPLHEHCLFKIGLLIGKLWNLAPLAYRLRNHKKHRFLLTAPLLDLPCAIASLLTPVATVRGEFSVTGFDLFLTQAMSSSSSYSIIKDPGKTNDNETTCSHNRRC
ncbi:cyclase family protein [Bartonella choladocola]|uniref:Cyclase n=1 Tax=Bartonella choladocola TaxID=2750995 RepID=A0A1U9MFR1_9HYPH|nr:cyclase family protein [Bartonella choladocola]AQT46550.1 Putative cyclase [Bartonella choladocola]